MERGEGLTSTTDSICRRTEATGGPTKGNNWGTRPPLPMRMFKRS